MWKRAHVKDRECKDVSLRKKLCPRFLIQVYVPQNTTVPQNTSFFYFSYKILRKRAIYFIFVNIY